MIMYVKKIKINK